MAKAKPFTAPSEENSALQAQELVNCAETVLEHRAKLVSAIASASLPQLKGWVRTNPQILATLIRAAVNEPGFVLPTLLAVRQNSTAACFDGAPLLWYAAQAGFSAKESNQYLHCARWLLQPAVFPLGPRWAEEPTPIRTEAARAGQAYLRDLFGKYGASLQVINICREQTRYLCAEAKDQTVPIIEGALRVLGPYPNPKELTSQLLEAVHLANRAFKPDQGNHSYLRFSQARHGMVAIKAFCTSSEGALIQNALRTFARRSRVGVGLPADKQAFQALKGLCLEVVNNNLAATGGQNASGGTGRFEGDGAARRANPSNPASPASHAGHAGRAGRASGAGRSISSTTASANGKLLAEAEAEAATGKDPAPPLGPRYRINVHISASEFEDLCTGRQRFARTDRGDQVEWATLDRVAPLDAVTIVGSEGIVVREVPGARFFTPEQREWMEAFQVVCAHPDCNVAARDCQAHHIVPVARGGTTTCDNLVLVCSHHHALNDDSHSVPGRFHYGKGRDGIPFMEIHAEGDGSAGAGAKTQRRYNELNLHHSVVARARSGARGRARGQSQTQTLAARRMKC